MTSTLRQGPIPHVIASALLYAVSGFISAATVPAQGTVAEGPPDPILLTGDPWSDMDYGPCMTLSLEMTPGNIAQKGIAIRLDEGPGGVAKGSDFMLFETDTLRVAGAWRGPAFINWQGIALNGQHEIHPKIVGDLLFSNPVGPGWGRPGDGSFVDKRVVGRDGRMYGPPDREWMKWRGLYLHEDRVLFSYTVGRTEVLELPGATGDPPTRLVTRTFNIGPREHDLILQVAYAPEATTEVIPEEDGPGVVVFRPDSASPDNASAASGVLDFSGKSQIKIARPEAFAPLGEDYTLYAYIKTDDDGTILSIADEGLTWVENGKSLFIRGGRLTFDIGWVGAAQSNSSVDDGDWHHVAMTFHHSVEGRERVGFARLYIDGVMEVEREMTPEGTLENQAVRIGYTSNDFPAASSTTFPGQMSEVGYYRRALSDDEIAAMARRFRNGNPDTLSQEGLLARWVMRPDEQNIVYDQAGNGHHGQLLRGPLRQRKSQAALVRGGPRGMAWIATEEGHLRLRIPAGEQVVRLCVVQGAVEDEDLDAFVSVADQIDWSMDLKPMTQGGPPRWQERIVTRGTLGHEPGAYVVDVLTPPLDNPYRSWMRFGGFDFFTDDAIAAICTWNGDVWRVSGIDDTLARLEWQRIATGLFQPLGVKIVNDDIFVLGRDQITRLHDLNGDGEADFYENFNNDHQVTEHFHEFALDLKVGADGDFYYTKGGRHGADAVVPQHGTLNRVARDGSRSEILANGLRAPNGLGLGPKGEMLIADNEGHWVPANRINWIRPGGFYGYMWGYHEGQEIDGFEPPLCWIHPSVDRSPGTFVWVRDERWGPLKDRVITVSYGMGRIFHVMYEEVDGVMQGGVVAFPLEFDSGVCRANFRDSDGQLYLAGLFGWAGNKTRPGGFYRVRYTEQPVHLPTEVHVAADGLSLTFTCPLDPARATDHGNYGVSVWNYRWRQEYGSPDYKRDGTEGRDTLTVDASSLSEDQKTVYLKIPDISEVMQMEIRLNLQAVDGTPITHSIYNTINVLPNTSIEAWMSDTVLRGPERSAIPEADLALGLVQTLWLQADTEDATQTDTRVSRLVALYCAEGQPVTPFLVPGPFFSIWEGFIRGDINDEVTFSAVTNGETTVTINGERVLETNAAGNAIETNVTAIRNGLNPIRVTYRSPPRGEALVRLYWESATIPREPVPATYLVRTDTPAELDRGLTLRKGRELLAQHRCVQCHVPDAAEDTWAMPELQFAGPKLDHVGQKLRGQWLTRYLQNPKETVPHSRMPALLRTEQEAADVSAYLNGLSPYQDSVDQPPDPETVTQGKRFYQDLGCFACHRFSDEDPYDPEDRRITFVDLSGKWRPYALTQYLQNPQADYPSSSMPNFQLTDAETKAIAQYLLSKSSGPNNDATGPEAQGNSSRGKELVTSRGCLNCHGLTGQTSTLTAASLRSLLSTDLEAGCLASEASDTRTRPTFSLDSAERDALRQFLREGLDSVTRHTPLEFAQRQVETLDCRACHAIDGRANTWSLVQPEEPVESYDNGWDDAFWDAEKVQEQALTIHYRRPPLDWAGEKLNSAWSAAFIAGELSYKARPKLVARMPNFPAHAAGLAEGLAQQHGFPPSAFEPRNANAAFAATGRQLTTADGGFNCAACHAIGDQPALAGQDTVTINFRHVAERLRPAYYHRYIRNPQRVLPGTQMPQFLTPNGESSIEDILEGDAQRQFDAIWEFMVELSGE